MKKIISYLTIAIFIIPSFSYAEEDYLFDNFESSPNATQIQSIKDKKTKYCEQVYLEAMRRRPFTKKEIKTCKKIFIKKILTELEYKRKVMQERYVY